VDGFTIALFNNLNKAIVDTIKPKNSAVEVINNAYNMNQVTFYLNCQNDFLEGDMATFSSKIIDNTYAAKGICLIF
jgi:hypothetical protein